MLAWRFTAAALPPGPRPLRSRALVRADASPDALWALDEGDGPWCALVELSGRILVEADGLLVGSDRESVVESCDATGVLVEQAIAWGCPWTAWIDPRAAALAWAPGMPHADAHATPRVLAWAPDAGRARLAAGDDLADRLMRHMQDLAEAAA